jgi:hypothetical protein
MRQFSLSHPDVYKNRFTLPAEVRFDPADSFRALRAVAEQKLDAAQLVARYLLRPS